MSMVVEQFLPAFHYGDATSNSAVAFHKYLIKNNIDSRIISLTSEKRIENQVVLFKNYKKNPKSIKILHFAIPSPLTDFFLKLSGKKVMIYHNITPSKFFIDYSDFLVKFTAEGRIHLEKLSDCFDISIGVSNYNASELRELKFKNVKVVPLFINTTDYEKSFNKDYYELIKDERKNILCVGRVAPNKCLEDAVKALFFYKKYISPSIRLIIAGNTGSVPRYFYSIRDIASRFYLTSDDIIFTGHTMFEEFLSLYELADVLLSVSEHEGFCLPIIEAFCKRVPVVAYDSAAISETLGEGGLLFRDKSPEKVAALLNYVLSNREVSETMKKNGDVSLEIYKKRSDPKNLFNLLKQL